jgi:hypothetical protein
MRLVLLSLSANYCRPGPLIPSLNSPRAKKQERERDRKLPSSKEDE